MVIYLYFKNTDDCFKEGALKKTQPSLDLAKKELKRAEKFLKDAFDFKDADKEDWAFTSLWWAFFHAGKALLWKDGIKEKSHICLLMYLSENYFKTGRLDARFSSDLDIMQSIRKDLQYSTVTPEIDRNFDELYNDCEDFIGKIKKLIES